MKRYNSVFVLALLLSFKITSIISNKIVCYHGSWSVYRQGNGKFTIEDINPNLCTHVIYSFVGVNVDGSIRILDPNNEITNNGFKRFNALKQLNPNLKTLVAIGGWNEGSSKFSQVAASASLRKALINNAVSLIQTYQFDGFDLDWEYPGQRDGSPSDKANFVKLIKEFREVFDQHGYLLTAAVAAATSVDISYDVPALSKYLDFINVMAYDFHGPWEPFTGQNAPLFPSAKDVTAATKELNVATCVDAWLNRGADAQKLVLGIGVYGRTYTLANPNNVGVGAPAIGAGLPGPYTAESGMLGYNEICEKQLSGLWTVKWSEDQRVPYAYSNNQWVGYDNPESVAIKMQFIKEKRLGGAMIWSIETDDFRGICGSKYPILAAINAGTDKNSPSTILTPTEAADPFVTSTTTRTSSASIGSSPTTTTTSNSIPSECSKPGYYRDPIICSRFYYCLQYGTGYIKYTFNCAKGLVFDPLTQQCNYESQVLC